MILCDDIWDIIAMNGTVLFVLRKTIKNFDIRFHASVKIQRFWKKTHIPCVFHENDRVLIINREYKTKKFATVHYILGDVRFISFKYISSKKHWVFYDTQSHNSTNVYYVKKLLPWN